MLTFIKLCFLWSNFTDFDHTFFWADRALLIQLVILSLKLRIFVSKVRGYWFLRLFLAYSSLMIYAHPIPKTCTLLLAYFCDCFLNRSFCWLCLSLSNILKRKHPVFIVLESILFLFGLFELQHLVFLDFLPKFLTLHSWWLKNGSSNSVPRIILTEPHLF